MIAALRCAVHRSNVPARVPVAEMTAGTFSLNTSTSLARRPAPRGQIKNSVPETSFKYGFTQAEFCEWAVGRSGTASLPKRV